MITTYMAELTQAEKTKYWSDIKTQWKIVKEGKNGEVEEALHFTWSYDMFTI